MYFSDFGEILVVLGYFGDFPCISFTLIFLVFELHLWYFCDFSWIWVFSCGFSGYPCILVVLCYFGDFRITLVVFVFGGFVGYVIFAWLVLCFPLFWVWCLVLLLMFL